MINPFVLDHLTDNGGNHDQKTHGKGGLGKKSTTKKKISGEKKKKVLKKKVLKKKDVPDDSGWKDEGNFAESETKNPYFALGKAKWLKGTDPEFQEDLSSWFGGTTSMHDIRTSERGKKTTEQVTRWNENLDKAPKFKGTLYRGMESSSGDKIKAYGTIGSIVTMKASSSASHSKSVGLDFSDRWGAGNHLLIKIKSKTAANLANAAPEEFSHEKEAILRAGTKYKVTSRKATKTEDGNFVEVTWEEL